MNSEVIKSLVRSTLVGLAGIIGTIGWKNAPTISAMLTNETVIGIVVAIAVAAWGAVSKTNKNAAIAAESNPLIAQIKMVPTVEGDKVVAATGSKVVSAG